MEKTIWFNKFIQVSDIRSFGEDNLASHLGMVLSEIGPDYLVATMPVDERTRQPYGLLHGGASVALAETLGSVASALVIDHTKYMCVGIEINANHVRSAKQGLVTGTATPIHLGKTTHVWDIKIYDERNKLVCISRLTVAILKREVAPAAP
jgi:1,4-dihydroxy-2-naphthoyl-CoA hydrolase